MEKQIITYIFAGNIAEYMHYCHRTKVSPMGGKYRYLAHLEILRGINNFNVITVGSWKERPDRDKISNLISSRHLRLNKNGGGFSSPQSELLENRMKHGVIIAYWTKTKWFKRLWAFLRQPII